MTSPAEVALGPLFIGWMGNIFLFGVVTVQCYIYLKSYKQDRLWTKVYVAVLYLANLVNTIFLAIYLYETLIKNFSDLEGLGRVDWLFATDPVMTGFIASQVQLFFVWRVKVLTGSTIAAIATLVPTVAGFTTVQTGAITSAFATIDIILFLVFPDNGLHLIFNVPLAKLYSTMLMSSLNSRKGWQYSSGDGGKMSSRPYNGGTTSFRNGRPAQIVVHVDAHEMTDRFYDSGRDAEIGVIPDKGGNALDSGDSLEVSSGKR
ncbi:hypothetical protein VKT23_019255 [Stygiomarasmius scandens]|uniref:Transmembrane protein n=1 Tax=Marasmiellus scandens TaxID=2682957 RepID=A0ABR1ILR5_9AGAR